MSTSTHRIRSTSIRTTPYGAGQFIQFQAAASDSSSSTPSVELLIPVPTPEPWPAYGLISGQVPSPASSTESWGPADSPPSTPGDTTIHEEGPTREQRNTSRGRPANHIPRPRNAFMLFRSDFWAKQKITKTVEADHRHISRIIGHCWSELSEEEKFEWRVKADIEKLEHAKMYPNYRFTPTVRAQKPIKRKVQRNGPKDVARCRNVAMLLLAGKQGGELESAVLDMDITARDKPDAKASDAPACPASAVSPNSSSTLPCPVLKGWKPAHGTSETIVFPDPFPHPTAPLNNMRRDPPPPVPTCMYDGSECHNPLIYYPPYHGRLDENSQLHTDIASCPPFIETPQEPLCNDVSPIYAPSPEFEFNSGSYDMSQFVSNDYLFSAPQSLGLMGFEPIQQAPDLGWNPQWCVPQY